MPGSAAVANNLAARLDGVRADALYAEVLFFFLGAPGVVLAILITVAIADAGASRRRREQALLRVRGASLSQALSRAAVEASIVGVAGSATGILLGLLADADRRERGRRRRPLVGRGRCDPRPRRGDRRDPLPAARAASGLPPFGVVRRPEN